MKKMAREEESLRRQFGLCKKRAETSEAGCKDSGILGGYSQQLATTGRNKEKGKSLGTWTLCMVYARTLSGGRLRFPKKTSSTAESLV
jgi:fructose-bisphosphate aldolase class 1